VSALQFNHAMVWSHDLPRALAFYQTLGFTRIVDSPHYARLLAPAGASTLSLHLADASLQLPPSAARTSLYFEADSATQLDETQAQLANSGVAISLPVDQPWGWREAHMTDPDGNPIVLYFAGQMRLDPPWKVKSD
jgi:catechol 2,3-dioxygenase-like lactoylglutathione lyase family enzyme